MQKYDFFSRFTNFQLTMDVYLRFFITFVAIILQSSHVSGLNVSKDVVGWSGGIFYYK